MNAIVEAEGKHRQGAIGKKPTRLLYLEEQHGERTIEQGRILAYCLPYANIGDLVKLNVRCDWVVNTFLFDERNPLNVLKTGQHFTGKMFVFEKGADRIEVFVGTLSAHDHSTIELLSPCELFRSDRE